MSLVSLKFFIIRITYVPLFNRISIFKLSIAIICISRSCYYTANGILLLILNQVFSWFKMILRASQKSRAFVKGSGIALRPILTKIHVYQLLLKQTFAQYSYSPPVDCKTNCNEC